MPAPQYIFNYSNSVIIGPEDKGEFYVGFYTTSNEKDTLSNIALLNIEERDEYVAKQYDSNCSDLFSFPHGLNDTIHVVNCNAELEDSHFERIEVTDSSSISFYSDCFLNDILISDGFLYTNKALEVKAKRMELNGEVTFSIPSFETNDECFKLQVEDLFGSAEIVKNYYGNLVLDFNANKFSGKYIIQKGLIKLDHDSSLARKGVELRRGATLINNAYNITDSLILSKYSTVVLNSDLFANHVTVKDIDGTDAYLPAGIYTSSDFEWLEGDKTLNVVKGVSSTSENDKQLKSPRLTAKQRVLADFKKINLNDFMHSSHQQCAITIRNNSITSSDKTQYMVIYYPQSDEIYLTSVPNEAYEKVIIEEGENGNVVINSHKDYTNEILFTQFIIVMILTVLIESLVFLIFYRNKKDIRLVAMINIFTNLFMNFCILKINNPTGHSYYEGVGFLFLLILFEPLVWIFESILFSCKLSKTNKHYKLKAWGVAFLGNLASLLLYIPLTDSVKSVSRFIWGF